MSEQMPNSWARCDFCDETVAANKLTETTKPAQYAEGEGAPLKAWICVLCGIDGKSKPAEPEIRPWPWNGGANGTFPSEENSETLGDPKITIL